MLTDNILLNINKPARYLGLELNMVKKSGDLPNRFLFCYPDVYEVGMSNMGLNILYYLLNNRDDTYCERVFAPWQDMEKILRDNNIPLFSLETKTPVKNFDFLGFTLQYEMSYTNILNILDMSNIPLLSKDRRENDPLILAGGPCVYNPEPLAEIVDFFYIGEGEVQLDKIMEIHKAHKEKNGNRRDFLVKLLDIEGIYVPRFYDVSYNSNGTIASFQPNHPKAKTSVRKVMVKDLTKMFAPNKQLLPLVETAHYRAALEIFRGCMRGCRFCQAGYTYRPLREKSVTGLIKEAKDLLESTGHEEMSLSSLSTGDYSNLPGLAESLSHNFSQINISLPSLRIDGITEGILSKIQKKRMSSITFAPEAGSQRLRDVINKDMSEEEIFAGARIAFKRGYSKLKLYFMMGLPTETDEDIRAINRLTENIISICYKMNLRNININLSVSCFVPKAFTPFQWEKQSTHEEFAAKQKLLKNSIKKKQINYKYHDAKTSIIEGIISRGDRRLAAVLIKAWELGAKFDGWSEFFDYNIWVEAFRKTGMDMDFYTRQREPDEILPWDHIDIGVSKEFLLNELSKSKEGKITENCRQSCSFCGIHAEPVENLTIKCYCGV